MKRIHSSIFELQLLNSCTVKMRKAILTNSDSKLIKASRECVYNVLKGNVVIPYNVSEKLDKYKSLLRRFVYDKSNLKSKRKLLIEKGGFLRYILPLVIELAHKN